MTDEQKKQLTDSVLKKAAGYESVETQEEYALVEGDMMLVKRKVITKDVPPDLAALKLLMGDDKPDSVTAEELDRERKELTDAYFALLHEKLREDNGAYREGGRLHGA